MALRCWETVSDIPVTPRINYWVSSNMVMMKVQHFLWVSIHLDLRHWQCTHRPHHHQVNTSIRLISACLLYFSQEASDARKWLLGPKTKYKNFPGLRPTLVFCFCFQSAKRRRFSARPNEAQAPHWYKNSQYSSVP